MPVRHFSSVLAANRSEIAIRIFRACTEMGIRTLGIFSHEDKGALHRYKADETYLIGEGKDPVKAYLDIEGIIELARRRKVDAIHPGYGFLAENPTFARACEAAGIVFIGPPPEVMELMADKVAARARAEAVGIPVVPGSDKPVGNLSAVQRLAKKIGYPVILKASFGGGGRGMRVAAGEEGLSEAFLQARRESEAAFGIGDVFIEKYLPNPKHVEVQILADAHGNVVHLFERDCSVQRRHQKVVEFAPSPSLSEDLRREICERAVTLAGSVGYVNAGTVEFLLDEAGNYYFIEMNTRIQVEHTVTEMITGVDLVKSQIRIAEGYPLASPEVMIESQGAIRKRGYAIQCRVTTEDPANNFLPDYGRISAYRSSAGFGIRLDAGTAFTGAMITPYYDSLLVKVTSHGLTFEESARKMRRALSEFRVRGLKTNIPFLENVVRHPRFLAGQCTTRFLEETPELLVFVPRGDRATKLLEFISDITINGNPDVSKGLPSRKFRKPVVPPYDPDTPPPPGTRQLFKQFGVEGFAQWILKQKRLLITETTLRDAHQSLLATRCRTLDMLRVAPSKARAAQQLFSLEMWGGATFDASLRFLQEDPWERLAQLRESIPNVLFQMLLRASNAVGYTNFPDNVVREFVKESVAAGIDVFRIFDSLNWVPGMTVAMDAVREFGGIAEPALCYTADIFDAARKKYDLNYYVRMALELQKSGAHILGIKDMAGLCRPYAARKLVKTLKEATGLPIHFHTHDTAGGQIASILMAAEAGVDIADVAIGSMSGLTSQPNLNTLVAALQRQPRDTGLDMEVLNGFSDYWEGVREYYFPFESELKAGAADVYLHEIPGGQYSNLRPQAESLGLGDRIPELKKMYATVNEMFGDIVKVTPSSKIVGDMALFMLTNNLTAEEALRRGAQLSFPESVIGFFAGEIGQVESGFPKDLQKVILKGRKPLTGRPGATMPPVDFRKVRDELERKIRRKASRREVLSYLLYPKVFLDFAEKQRKYSDVSVVPTEVFFYGLGPGDETEIELEEGKTLFLKLVAISEPDEEGARILFYELNGHPREVKVIDRSLGIERKVNPKADPDNLHHVACPMPGLVVDVVAKPGDMVQKDQKLLVIEAMKMETTLYSPMPGVIKEAIVGRGSKVETGDLLFVFE